MDDLLTKPQTGEDFGVRRFIAAFFGFFFCFLILGLFENHGVSLGFVKKTKKPKKAAINRGTPKSSLV
jgi:hypothetical protein